MQIWCSKTLDPLNPCKQPLIEASSKTLKCLECRPKAAGGSSDNKSGDGEDKPGVGAGDGNKEGDKDTADKKDKAKESPMKSRDKPPPKKGILENSPNKNDPTKKE